MKRVYTADSIAMAWHVKNVLEHHEIHSIVRNDGLLSTVGEVPVTECQPEVWVLNDLNERYAHQLVLELLSEPEQSGEDWCCKSCGESNLANYAICWNCQASVDELTDEN